MLLLVLTITKYHGIRQYVICRGIKIPTSCAILPYNYAHPRFLCAHYLFTPNKQIHNYTPTRQTNTTAFHLYLPCLPFSVAIKLEPSTSQSFSMHINMHYTSTTQLPSTPPSVHNKHKGKNWRNGVKVLWCHIIPIFFG